MRHRIRRRDRRRSALSLESHRLFPGVLRVLELRSGIQSFLPDRHHHGRSSAVSSVPRIACLPGSGDLRLRGKAQDVIASAGSVGPACVRIRGPHLGTKSGLANRAGDGHPRRPGQSLSYKLHQLLAASLFESDPASFKNIDRVIKEQGKSLALLDALPARAAGPDSYRQAGYYLLLKGDLEHEHDGAQSATDYRSALRAVERCISIDQISRGNYLPRADARSSARFAALPQGDAQAYLLLSLVYQRLGDVDKATRRSTRRERWIH